MVLNFELFACTKPHRRAAELEKITRRKTFILIHVHSNEDNMCAQNRTRLDAPLGDDKCILLCTQIKKQISSFRLFTGNKRRMFV